MQYNPWVRIISLRCLGSLNLVWVADALSKGIDGIFLLGCQHGDQYQCHFIKGSELMQVRSKNIQEKLKQLALEQERQFPVFEASNIVGKPMQDFDDESIGVGLCVFNLFGSASASSSARAFRRSLASPRPTA